MTWKDAIIYILQSNRTSEGYQPMHYRDITDAIIEKKLRDKYGKTPADTVNAYLSTNKDLFESLGGGEYRLTATGEDLAVKKQQQPSQQLPAPAAPPVAAGSRKLIKNYGMYWVRDGINWNQNPRLWGVQSTGAAPIDLSEMRGIYMLYDGREVVYVGQAADQPILKRLIKHTKNRLATRWNRFSWFGIDNINSDGAVVKIGDSIATDINSLVDALEGILIEGLEPRQNRRQGDNFGFEYYQEIDKDIAKNKLISDFQKLL